MKSITILTLSLIFINGIWCRTVGLIQKLNLTEYCPKTNFCTERASSNYSIKGRQPCCASCLCTNDCHMHGNCCPDAERLFDKTDLMPECYFPVYNIDFETQDLYDNDIFTGINSYNAFVKCPKNYKNDTMREKCEGNPKRLEDIALVSNEQGYVYKNKHCALCNGVETFLSWGVMMKCPSSAVALDFQNALPVVKQNTCMIWSFPKNAKNGRRSLCFKVFDKCGVHSPLQHACNSYTLYYFNVFRGSVLLFKNVHCFMCEFHLETLKGSCPLMPSGAPPNRDTFFIPITAIIGFESQTQEEKSTETKLCSASDIYDSYFDKCRPLKCPPTTHAYNGNCVSYYKNIYGFSISILVIFQPISKQKEFGEMKSSVDQSEEIRHDSFYSEIVTTFTKSITKTMKECGICSTVAYEKDQHMYLYILFRTNTQCTINDLFTNAYEYAEESHQFSINFEGETFTFIARTVFNNHGIVQKMTSKYRLGKKFCDYPIPFNFELICPKITLNKTEYDELMVKREYRGKVLVRKTIRKNDKNGKEAGTVFTGNVDNKTTQQFEVCLNEYNAFFNTGSLMHKLDWWSSISFVLYGPLMIISTRPE